MTFSILGIYKHDFRDCPEELRELRAGDSLYMEAALQEEGEEDDKEEEHIEGYREANAPVGATERPEGYSEEPFDCYFTDRATDKDRREMLEMLRVLCRRDKIGNNAAQVCRQLKQWEKEGMTKNVFYCRKELYTTLLHYGFGWKEGSLYNAITKVMGEK